MLSSEIAQVTGSGIVLNPIEKSLLDKMAESLDPMTSESGKGIKIVSPDQFLQEYA